MESTRQSQPFPIFQDSIPSPASYGPTTKPRPQLQPSAMPLQALHNPPGQPGIMLNAPYSQPQQMSPVKTHLMSPPTLDYGNIPPVYIPPPPSACNIYTDSPIKRAAIPQMHHYRPQPMMQQQQPLFTTFNSNFDPYEQENYQVHSQPLLRDNFVDFPEPSYSRKDVLKRSYSEAASNNDRPFKRIKNEEEALAPMAQLPEPEDMPAVEDDGNKPTYSYAHMIGMAILRAPHRRLTLAQIYDWISTTFAFYREDTKQGWHNSIRHNLSLNKAFKKQERPKGDAGKGSYWVIEPGMEMTFVKDKNRKGNTLSHVSMHASIMRTDMSSASVVPTDQPTPSHHVVQSNAPPLMSSMAPPLPELSSDATVPASDPALHEDDNAEYSADHFHQPHSSPPDAINSSPPIAAINHRRSGSSPTGRMRQPSSLLKHRRNATTAFADDSGYISSLESSVMRPNKHNNTYILTSELDIESNRRIQSGRAEAAIARIRSSSHDLTPSHGRHRNVNLTDGQGSSPIGPSPSIKLYPTTPSVVFKKPMQPPPSVSPNTQLHRHRQHMQDFSRSPAKGFGWTDYQDMTPNRWSSTHHPVQEEFQIFSDPAIGMTPTTPACGSSPLRGASIKRPSFARANTTGNVLAEVLGNAHRSNYKTPSKNGFLKPGPHAVLTGSPLKGSVTSVPLLDPDDEFLDFNSFENDSETEGVDISKGFCKIGGAVASLPISNGTNQVQRPQLGGRSFTSRF